MAENPTNEILSALRAQDEATTRGDAAGVTAPLASDVVVYDLPPPLEQRGTGPRHIEGLNAWFDTWDGPVRVELVDSTVMVEGDLAVVFGLSRMQGDKKGSGPVDSWNRRTVVLRRTGGAWQIAHEHASYPLEMDGSGRAATNLKPE